LTWLLNNEEKEEYVIRLCKENKSFREIAKIMHMSFRDIAAIINKWKEQEKGQLDDDIKSKSKTTQAIKLFSQDKNPVDVVIALDLPSEEVQAIYREYWELKSMFSLAQIYDEAEYDLNDLLRLHRIFKNLGMSEKEIINVLELAKNNQLQYLQWKVEYLRNDIDMLEVKKAKATNDILKLNRITDEFQSSLSRKGGEMTYMEQEPRMLQGSINYNTDYSYPNINWYSVDISYTPMNDYSAEPPDVIDNFVK
jgi:transposase